VSTTTTPGVPEDFDGKRKRKRIHDELCERTAVFYAEPERALIQLWHWTECLHEAKTTSETIMPFVLMRRWDRKCTVNIDQISHELLYLNYRHLGVARNVIRRCKASGKRKSRYAVNLKTCNLSTHRATLALLTIPVSVATAEHSPAREIHYLTCNVGPDLALFRPSQKLELEAAVISACTYASVNGSALRK
jgi:hypothetical protein